MQIYAFIPLSSSLMHTFIDERNHRLQKFLKSHTEFYAALLFVTYG